MVADFSPLIKNRDYRLLYFGQLISTFGKRVAGVALPYQVYRLTGSSLAVGTVGFLQLVPLLFTALVGGAYADALDRKKLLMVTEILLAACSAMLAFNSWVASQSLWLIYLMAAMASGLSGFHAPALSALTRKLIRRDEIAAASALNSLRDTAAAVAGPAFAGILIALLGLTSAYVLDVVSFGLSLLTLLSIGSALTIVEKTVAPGWHSIVEGLKYARSREELIGTYAVDFIAVVFGMPMALFPAFADTLGGVRVLGWLYSAPAAGAFLVAVFSRWTGRVERQGRALVLAAIVWGLAIVAFGFSHNIELAILFLAIAGGADAVSGIFRQTIWNTTIPESLRGRLAGIEMVSYMSGPLLGNTESGLVAAATSSQVSIISGGFGCVFGVVALAFCLPRLWQYQTPKTSN